MSYQDDLNSEEWRAKRKEIIIRDNLKCTVCSNKNLITNCLVGLLSFEGNNENGSLFKYHGYDSSETRVTKKVFLKRGSLLIPFGSGPNLVYIDPEFEDEPFQHVTGIRELQQIDDKLPVNPFGNIISKLGPDAFDKIMSEGYELPLHLLYGERFKEKADKLKGKIADDYKWKYVPALHVHHTYYQINLKPWEYPNESLQTLCWVCHENLHKNQSIPFLDENGNDFSKLTSCWKCFGAGWIPEYKYFKNGICFNCWGAKYEELIETKYEM